MPDGAAAVWRTHDGGDNWIRGDIGLPQHDAYLGVLREAMARDDLEPVGRLLRDEHRAPVRLVRRRGELGPDRDDAAPDLVGRRGQDRRLSASMAHVILPRSLAAILPGLPRRAEVEGATVAEVVAALDASWPGVADRLLEPDRPSGSTSTSSSMASGPSWRPRCHRARRCTSSRRSRAAERRSSGPTGRRTIATT